MKGVLLMAKKHEQNFLNEVRKLTKETTDVLHQKHLEAVNGERLQLMTKIKEAAKAGRDEINVQNIYEENIIFFNESGFFTFLYTNSFSVKQSHIISWRNYEGAFSFPPTSYHEKKIADAIITAEADVRNSEFCYISIPHLEVLSFWLRKNGYTFSYDNYEAEYKIRLEKDTRRTEDVCN